MLSFGKSSSGRRGIIGTKWFDPYKGEPRQMSMARAPRFILDEERLAEMDKRWVANMTKDITPKKPGRGNGIEVHWAKRDESDLVEDDDNDLDLDHVQITHHAMMYTLRENREWNARMNLQRKITELHMRFWWMDRAAAEEQVKDEQRDKPKCDPRGHVYIESNLEGEEKLATTEARYQKLNGSKKNQRNRQRNGLSWKNKRRRGLGCHSDRVYNIMAEEKKNKIPGDDRWIHIWDFEQKNFPDNATKQWARHKPKFHCAWTIGDEMSAAFTKREREVAAWNTYVDKMRAQAEARMMEEFELNNEHFNMQEAA
ncbi:MAG: hypothetical protein NTX72_04930 [Candidatus Uhrbacteria bacterium]|nr:hypothetical protein [Candidatus Uhrbacteria bacterium]